MHSHLLSICARRTARLLPVTLAVVMAFSVSGFAQAKGITVKLKGGTLSELIRTAESQSDYRFFYESHSVDVSTPVTVDVKDAPIETVLTSSLAQTGIAFRVIENRVMLFPGEVSTPQTARQTPITVRGTVVDANGEPVVGAHVLRDGTTQGVFTDVDGRFSIDVPTGAYLHVSFMGFVDQVVPVTGSSLTITLQEDSRTLDAVVVTALGITKKEKSLTYATQVVNGDELVRAKDPNMMNSLAGKTAGVQILRSSAGLGGSVKINIRGSRSVNGSNQPLYVIDGMPINSSANDATATTIGGNNDSGNRDGGDGISNLNPDDIESMNILKGPAAAALYGSSAANGVVIITTRKGSAGRTNVSFSNNTTFEKAAYGIPEFQDSYGGVTTSWGDPISTKEDYVKDFFKTGITTINSLTMSGGNEKAQTYFSYANTYGTGIVGNGRLVKHNLNFRETGQFFDGHLTADANVNLVYQMVNDRPTPGGYYLNPLVGLYRFPRGGGIQGGQPFSYYRDEYQIYNASRNMYLQNWYKTPDSFEENPYWIINKTPSQDKRYRALSNLTLSWKFNEYFTLAARGNVDFISDAYEKKMYAGTDASLAQTNGRYISDLSHSLSVYGDVMLTYRQTFGDVAVNASAGASIKDDSGKNIGIDSYSGGMYNPNLFSLRNIDLNNSSSSLGKSHGQSQAVFFAGQIGFKDWLFLDITARNDWTSTLAFTNYLKKGFFYPSAGLTWIMSEALSLPSWVNLGKVRAAWSQVGNGLPAYRSNPLNSVGRSGVISYNTTAPFSELKPEMTSSLEFGTEWRFFDSRLELDLTYYKTNTKNQLFSLSAPSGSKYNTYYVNAGNIENKGFEAVVSITPVLNNNFSWKTSFNGSLNRNKVLELAEGLGYFSFGGGGSNNYGMRLEVGGSFGDLYGRTFQRDESGNIMYDSEDIPIADKGDLKKIGNTSPKFNLGWANTLTWKGVTLYMLFDGRFGGDVLSLTNADLDKYGVTKATGDARKRGGVELEGKTIKNVERFYTIVGGRDGVTEYYLYDATNIRLRELSIGYALPAKWLSAVPVVRGVDVSFIGRNLFFLMNNAPYDPDGALSVGNGLQGVDAFGTPSTRSFGFNVKLTF